MPGWINEWSLGCFFGVCCGTISTLIVVGIEGMGYRWQAILVFTALGVGVFTFYALNYCGKAGRH